MATTCELLDTLTGNVVGIHPTEAAALRSVAEMVRRWGEGAVVRSRWPASDRTAMS